MFRFKSTGPYLLALALAGPALSAAAQTSSSAQQQQQPSAVPSSAKTSGSQVPAADRSFMRKAAEGGLLEVELGKVAQQKAANDQVKQFGTHMEKDHSQANDELKQIAASKGVELPTLPGQKEQKAIDRLKTMSGAEFDRAYMRHMVSDHKKDIAAFEKEAKGGKDADVRMFAEKTVPTLRKHLEMAQRTQDIVKKGASGK